MEFFTSGEYEYAKQLAFFGFICGITFSALIVTMINLYKGDKDDTN